MAILLALLSALAYGISDFGAGVASRRSEAGVVSMIVLAIGLVCAAIATAIDPGVGARAGALLWGAASGQEPRTLHQEQRQRRDGREVTQRRSALPCLGNGDGDEHHHRPEHQQGAPGKNERYQPLVEQRKL